MESSDQWKCRDREVQMETENTDPYERSEKHSGGMNRGMAGKMERERKRAKKKGEDYL